MTDLDPSAFDTRDCRFPCCPKEAEWSDGMCGQHHGQQIESPSGALIPGALAHLADDESARPAPSSPAPASLPVARCKVAGCSNGKIASHGVYAGLCAEHKRVKQRANQAQRDAKPQAAKPPPTVEAVQAAARAPAPPRTLTALSAEIEALDVSIASLNAERAATLADLAELINEMAA